MKVKVWAVMISFKNPDGVIRTGYHSVWKTKEMAERQAKIRNNAGFRMRYTVEEKEGTLMSRALLKGTIKFDDSVGAMIIQEYEPWELEADLEQ